MDEKTIIDLLYNLEDVRKLLGEALNGFECDSSWIHPMRISKEEIIKRAREGFQKLNIAIEMIQEEIDKVE